MEHLVQTICLDKAPPTILRRKQATADASTSKQDDSHHNKWQYKSASLQKYVKMYSHPCKSSSVFFASYTSRVQSERYLNTDISICMYSSTPAIQWNQIHFQVRLSPGSVELLHLINDAVLESMRPTIYVVTHCTSSQTMQDKVSTQNA